MCGRQQHAQQPPKLEAGNCLGQTNSTAIKIALTQLQSTANQRKQTKKHYFAKAGASLNREEVHGAGSKVSSTDIHSKAAYRLSQCSRCEMKQGKPDQVSISGLTDAHAGLSGDVQCSNSQGEWWQGDSRSWSIECDVLLARHHLHSEPSHGIKHCRQQYIPPFVVSSPNCWGAVDLIAGQVTECDGTLQPSLSKIAVTSS